MALAVLATFVCVRLISKHGVVNVNRDEVPNRGAVGVEARAVDPVAIDVAVGVHAWMVDVGIPTVPVPLPRAIAAKGRRGSRSSAIISRGSSRGRRRHRQRGIARVYGRRRRWLFLRRRERVVPCLRIRFGWAEGGRLGSKGRM